MKRILITGACGFLGHHVVEHFLKGTSAQIIGIDRLSYASAGFDRLRDIDVFDDRRVMILAADLSQPLSPGVAREIGDVEFIIHAAAETHVDNSIIDPRPFVESNVLGTHNVLMLARGLRRLKRLFLISTDEVYGPASFGHPGYGPEDRFRPTNPYAATKAAAECLSFAYAHTFGIPVTIVNTMNLFGERQHPEKFIPKTIRNVEQGRKVLIHADPTRTISGTRFYIHCRNFASALLFLMDRIEDGLEVPPKLHVAGEKEVPNLRLAELIAEALERPLDCELIDFHSSRPGHDLRYALDDHYIRELGWKAPLPFEESLARTVRWYTRHRRWLAWDAEHGLPVAAVGAEV